MVLLCLAIADKDDIGQTIHRIEFLFFSFLSFFDFLLAFTLISFKDKD